MIDKSGSAESWSPVIRDAARKLKFSQKKLCSGDLIKPSAGEQILKVMPV